VRALVDAIRRRPGIAVHGLRCSLLIRHRTARNSRRAFYPGVTSKSMTPCFEIWNELSSRQGTGCRGDSRCCADRSPCLEARGPVRLQLGGAAVDVKPSCSDAHRASIGARPPVPIPAYAFCGT
jgi:hypothetical protein